MAKDKGRKKPKEKQEILPVLDSRFYRADEVEDLIYRKSFVAYDAFLTKLKKSPSQLTLKNKETGAAAIYDFIHKIYNDSLGIKPEEAEGLGQDRLLNMFRQDTGVPRRQFIENLTPKLDRNTLGNISHRMVANMTRNLNDASTARFITKENLADIRGELVNRVRALEKIDPKLAKIDSTKIYDESRAENLYDSVREIYESIRNQRDTLAQYR